jgi:dienelactone hydrolase
MTSEYFESSGKRFTGLLTSPRAPQAPARADERRPGILVLHGGAGLGEHERERSRMLAELGYVAFAPDLFGERFEDRAHGVAVLTALVAEPRALRARVSAALGWLRGQPNVDGSRTAAIGFCFGGLAALELARSGADVKAVVSFHGGLGTQAPARPREITSKVLVCTGSADPFVTREHRSSLEDELTAAGADWHMLVHGGALHGFTEASPTPRPGCAYHRGADRQSWAAMRETLAGAFA